MIQILKSKKKKIVMHSFIKKKGFSTSNPKSLRKKKCCTIGLNNIYFLQFWELIKSLRNMFILKCFAEQKPFNKSLTFFYTQVLIIKYLTSSTIKVDGNWKCNMFEIMKAPLNFRCQLLLHPPIIVGWIFNLTLVRILVSLIFPCSLRLRNTLS